MMTKHSLPVPFIVGVPRSGTTLLRLMLDSHPDLCIPPETHFIPGLVQACVKQNTAQKFIQSLLSHPRWPDFHLDQTVLIQTVLQLNPFTVEQGIKVFYDLYAEKSGKTRWGDKTPGYMMHMNQIEKLIPGVRFIHVIRDGRDVFLSVRDLWWGPNTADAAADLWKKSIQQARSQARGLQHYLEIHFEALVAETEPVLKQICDFIQLDYTPGMLQYHLRADQRLQELDREVLAPDGRKISSFQRKAIFEQVRCKPNLSRTRRWEHGMSAPEKAIFLDVAGDMLQDLGYVRSTD